MTKLRLPLAALVLAALAFLAGCASTEDTDRPGLTALWKRARER